MIRRDYILRMLEQFFEVLSRIRALQKRQLFQEAAGALDEELQRLMGADAQTVVQWSETELLARVIQGEPTQAVREKTLMLTTLFKEAGDVATAQGRLEQGRACYLKGLHLLLNTMAHGETSEFPDFVPRLEAFLGALGSSPLPLSTLALLMRHHELAGEFGRAEDMLYSMMDTEREHPGIVDFGISFYERLQGRSDASLAAGNLPRGEIEAGLAELRGRKTKVPTPPPPPN